jgi:hypothetical protein
MRSPLGYVLGVALLVAGVFVGGRGLVEMFASRVPHGDHLKMPGRGDLAVPAGASTLSVELPEPSDFRPHCTVIRGAATLEPVDEPVSYAVAGGYGHSAFVLRAEQEGPVALECDGATPYVLAIGAHVGWAVVIAVIAGFSAAMIGLGLVALTFVRRRA